MIKMEETSESIDILIIDKDPILLKKYKNLFEESKYKTITADNNSLAMQIVVMNNPEVIIIDIDSTGIGNDLLRGLRKIGVEAQIILHSEQNTIDIQYKRQTGLIFTFVKKGEGFERLLSAVTNAKETYQKIHSINDKIRKEDATYKRDLEWFIWQQRKNHNSKYALGKTIIETLSHSIFQGMGMGAALSTIDLMEMSKKPDGDSYKIKANLMTSLVQNAEYMRLIKDRLDNMIYLLDKEYEKERITAKRIMEILKNSIAKTEDFRKIKNHRIIHSSFTHEDDVFGNSELLGLSFRELLINAYKYSPDNSNIFIMKGYSSNGLSLLLMNSITKVTRGVRGIPSEYENEIFEPFFRINRIYDERFFLEELGFGVGLSVIQKGITSLDGNIFVYEVNDHVTALDPEKKIVAELVLRKAE